MAQLGAVFDATTVEPNKPREIIPAGKYIAQIIKSDMLPTNAGTGQYLKLQYEIIEGEFAGHPLWNQLNLINPNPQAVEIAQRDLSAICHAVGEMAVSDSEQLHLKPLTITVKVRPAGPDKSGVMRAAQNEVAGHEAAGSTPLPAPAAAAQRPATPAAAAPRAPTASAKAPPPWAKKTAA